ncbi:hypothetical protein R6Q59_011120 [Mikania micrantha]
MDRIHIYTNGSKMRILYRHVEMKTLVCGEADHTIKDCSKPNGNVVDNASRLSSVVPPTTGGKIFALSIGKAPTEAELA